MSKTYPNTTAAVDAIKTYAAERAVHDPVRLDRAVRIMKAALARGVVTIEDLVPPSDEDDQQ